MKHGHLINAFLKLLSLRYCLCQQIGSSSSHSPIEYCLKSTFEKRSPQAVIPCIKFLIIILIDMVGLLINMAKTCLKSGIGNGLT